MPSWLRAAIIMIVKFVGIPFAKGLAWLKWVPEEFWLALPALLETIKAAPDRAAAVVQVKQKLDECRGSFCPANTKAL